MQSNLVASLLVVVVLITFTQNAIAADAASDKSCLGIKVDSRTYYPGDKIKFAVESPSSPKEAMKQIVTIAWDRSDLTPTLLRYDRSKKEFVGEILVPARLPKNWGMAINVASEGQPNYTIKSDGTESGFKKPTLQNVVLTEESAPVVRILPGIDITKIDRTENKYRDVLASFIMPINYYQIQFDTIVKPGHRLTREYSRHDYITNLFKVIIKNGESKKELKTDAKNCIWKNENLLCTVTAKVEFATVGSEEIHFRFGDWNFSKTVNLTELQKIKAPRTIPVEYVSPKKIQSFKLTKEKTVHISKDDTIGSKNRVMLEALVYGGTNADQLTLRLSLAASQEKLVDAGQLECNELSECKGTIGVYDLAQLLNGVEMDSLYYTARRWSDSERNLREYARENIMRALSKSEYVLQIVNQKFQNGHTDVLLAEPLSADMANTIILGKVNELIEYLVEISQRDQRDQRRDRDHSTGWQRSNLNADEACGIVTRVKIGG